MKIKQLIQITLLTGSACSLALADPPSDVKEATPEKAKPTATKEAEKPAPATPPAQPPAPKLSEADMKKYASHGFGYRTGEKFRIDITRFGLSMDDLDVEVFTKGLIEAFGEGGNSVSDDDVNAAFNQFRVIIQEREKALAVENLEKSEQFLEENKKREGVITTTSGLQYEILKKGEGEIYKAPENQPPGPNRTQFMIQYTGTLIDGTEFDSSKGESIAMGMSTVEGFKEALTTMPIGSTWKIYLSPKLAYGEGRRSELIGPNSALIFDVSLEDIKYPPAAPPSAFRNRPTPPRKPASAVSPPIRVPVPNDKKADEKKPAAVTPPVGINSAKKKESAPPKKAE